MAEYEKVARDTVRWIKKHKPTTFRYGDATLDRSKGMVEFPCIIGSKTVKRRLQGTQECPFAGEPVLKELGAKIDRAADTLELTKLGA